MSWLPIPLYLFALVAFVLYERNLIHEDDATRRLAQEAARTGVLLLFMGALAAFADLASDASRGETPFSSSRSALAGLSLGWVLIGVAFILRMRVYLLGLIVTPLALLASLVIATAPRAAHVVKPESMIEGFGILIHAVLGYAGYSSFFAAALGAGLYLLQDRELRLKRMGALFDHLPPLDRSTEIMRLGVKCGLYFIVTGILVAMIFLRGTVRPEQLFADANVRVLVVLCLYAAVILGFGTKLGWSKGRVVWMSFLLGILVIVIHAFFILGETFHSFPRS